jgi:hypothetical protein
MGQEIVYCFKCQTRLKGEEFEKGSAFRIGDKTCCATCAVGLLTSLPPEEQQSILSKVMNSQNATTKKLVVNGEVIEPGGPSTPTPRPTDGTTKTKIAPPRTSRAPAQKKSTQRLLAGEGKLMPFLVGGGLIVAAVIGLIVVLGGSRGRGGPPVAAHANEPESNLPEKNKPADEGSKPDEPLPDPIGGRTRLPSAAAREETARKSLDKARAADPADLGGKVRLYQQAVWDSEGTPFFDEATKELAPLLEKWKGQLAAELAALDDAIRASAEKEEFKSAMDALEKARRKHADADWTAPIDRKASALRNQMDETYRGLKGKAIEAKKRGDTAAVTPITERVGKWGFADYAQDLAKALSDVTAAPSAVAKNPAPTPEPEKKPEPAKAEDEGVTYRARWDKAMALAATRDYAGATRELEQATSPLQDATLRGEALGDLEVVRLVSALYSETMELLAEWPEGRALSVRYFDEAGNKKSVSEPVVHSTRYRAEVKKGKKDTQFVEYMDIEAESLAKIFKGRKNKQKTDGKAAAYLCLLEGDDDTAKSVLGEPVSVIPERYWALGKRVKEQRAKTPKPDPEAVKKEKDAREIVYAAEKEFRVMASRQSAVEKYKTLLNSYADTRIVKHHLESMTLRSEGDKEYILTADEFKGVGIFRSNRDPKDGQRVWLAEMEPDSSKPNDNYIEIEFYATPGSQYRIYLHYAGCCVETMSLRMQGTDLVGTNQQNQQVPIEPGGNTFMNVSFRNDKYPSRHADHGGGRKEPTIWQWLQLNSPRYAAGGLKKLRFIGDHMGVSFKYVVISSIRNTFPTPADVKKYGDDR